MIYKNVIKIKPQLTAKEMNQSSKSQGLLQLYWTKRNLMKSDIF